MNLYLAQLVMGTLDVNIVFGIADNNSEHWSVSTEHPPSRDRAKKMKLLKLHTHGYRVSLR